MACLCGGDETRELRAEIERLRGALIEAQGMAQDVSAIIGEAVDAQTALD